MKTTTVKKEIKKRFGSMTKFAILIGVDRYELQKFFAAAEKNMTPERQARLKQLDALAKSTKDKPIATDLTPEICDVIKREIENKYQGGIPEFCERHDFANTSVHQIIKGYRKTITPGIKKMLSILEIEYDKRGT